MGMVKRSNYNYFELGCLMCAANRSNCNCAEFGRLIDAAN